MPRGGRRKGQAGKTYAMRTDLNQPDNPAQPTFKGQPYGAAKQQQAVQASGPPPGAPGSLRTPGGGPPETPMPGVQALPLNRPTERPMEPVTAGLPGGPGPGPEVLRMNSVKPDEADIAAMAVYLPALEQLAMLPGASLATKQFVRRLRGAIPPSQET